MKFKILYLSFILIPVVLSGQNANISLLPLPKTIVIKTGQLRIGRDLIIGVSMPGEDELLQTSIRRLIDKINKKSNDLIHPQIRNIEKGIDTAQLMIITGKSEKVHIGMDESYALTVTPNQMILQANNTIGAMRGMETILQLLSYDDKSYYFPVIEVHDAPRFGWRGLMIDVSRHFIPIDIIKRNIEAMAEVKMNVLHLHLSDNEGFRFESNKFPELQGKGSEGHYYKQSELKDLVRYAGERGIIIVPEFDMPGHSKSWFAGYPELASAPGPYVPGTGYKIDPANPVNPANLLKFIKTYPTPAMNPSLESTYAFLDSFISEVRGVFPSIYIHIGVDENNGVVWKNNPAIVDFMNRQGMSSTEELQAYFARRVDDIVKKYHRQTIGWEEMYTPSVSKNVLLQVWDTRAPKTRSVEMLQHGNSEICSRGYYLDLFMPAYVHYLNDPLPFACPDSLRSHVLGGEAAMWTELANEENIESRIWPRTAAIAERFWSPASAENVNDMYRRLFVINKSLAQQGLHHLTNYERRIHLYSNAQSFEHLKTLIDVLSPVKGYKRVMALILNTDRQHTNNPLNEVADIAWVDPEVRRKFRMKVASYLELPATKKEKEIRDILYSWSKNHDKIDSLLKSDSKLHGIIIHSKNLSEVARIGIQALDYLHMKIKPPVSWSSEKLAVLKSASASHAEVELSIIPEIEALIKQKLGPEQKGFPIF